MEGESGEQVGGELESVTSSAGCFVQGWRNDTGSWPTRSFYQFINRTLVYTLSARTGLQTLPLPGFLVEDDKTVSTAGVNSITVVGETVDSF